MSRPMASRMPRGLPAYQSGVVLFISLIVLVAMSLAGIALVRSVDTNVLIAGNLAFRQAAILAGERAVADARQFVVDNSGDLKSDRPADGYFSATAIATGTSRGFDPVKHDWANSKSLYGGGADASGNRVRYVIHRMCAEPDKEPTATNCVRAGATGTATSSFGSIDYSRYPLTLSSTVPAYRITVRIDAPKNSVSYVQVVVFP